MEKFEYKKTTKYDIDFPAYCYFFLEKLIQSSNCLVKPYDKLDVEIKTTTHEYCYDAFELIARTMKRKGILTRIPTFVRNKDTLCYKFKLEKMINVEYDDLPF
jgi:hypothetical protein